MDQILWNSAPILEGKLFCDMPGTAGGGPPFALDFASAFPVLDFASAFPALGAIESAKQKIKTYEDRPMTRNKKI